MPATNADGRVAQPSFKHVKFNAAPLYKDYPNAGEHAEHHRRIGLRHDQARKGLRLDVQEQQERIAERTAEMSFASGLDDKMTDEDGKPLPTKRETYMAEIHEMKVEVDRTNVSAKELPRNRSEELDQAASNAHKAGHKFTQVAMADFAVPESFTVKEGFENYNAAISAKQKDTRANLPTEEICAQLDAYAAEIKADPAASLGLAALCAGGGPASIHLPSFVDLAQPAPDGHTHAFMLPDMWKVLIQLDHDGVFLNNLKTTVAKYNAQFPQLSAAEKANLQKAHDAKIIEAARRLEFACRREEAKGVPVKRPREFPWTVMLWLAPAPRLKVIRSDSNFNFEGE